MKFKVLILFLLITNSIFSQKRHYKNWMNNFYNATELFEESSISNKNILIKLKKSFNGTSLESKKGLRYLSISPKDIEKITKKFTQEDLSEMTEFLTELSPRATRLFYSDLARYSNNDRIENLLKVIKEDKRILESYERVSSFMSVKFRTNVGVLLQIADRKNPIKIKTSISQKHKKLYKKKRISSNGLVFEGYFPDFNDYTAYKIVLPKNLIKAFDSEQMKFCTRKLRKELLNNPSLKKKFNKVQLKAIEKGQSKIPGYTWHHLESKVGGMDLVESDIHNKVPHDGGVAFWGGGER